MLNHDWQFYSFIFCLACLVYVLWGVALNVSAKDWPKVKGKILISRIETSYDIDNGRQDNIRLMYEYEVNGKKYLGKRLMFGYIGSNIGWLLAKSIRQYDENRTVWVYYLKRKPSKSLLKVGFTSEHLFSVIFFGVLGLLYLSKSGL